MQKQIVPKPPNHAKGVRINAATSGDAISFPFTIKPSVQTTSSDFAEVPSKNRL